MDADFRASSSPGFRCLKFKLASMISVAVAETKRKKGINTKLWFLIQPGRAMDDEPQKDLKTPALP